MRRCLLAKAPLHVSVLAGPPPPGLAPLLSLHDEKSVEILLLGADRDDLVLRFRTRAAVAGLDSPALRVRGALRGFSPGAPLEITVSPDHNARCIDVNRAPTCGLGFTAGIGWAFLFFGQNIPWPFHPLLNVVWIAAVWFPSGFWARGRQESLVAVALLLAALLLLPGPTGLLDTPASEIGAAVAGLLAGRGLGSRHAAKLRIRREWQPGHK